MSKQMKSSLMLTLTALIWGAAFVAQSVGMDYVGPFTFNASRFLIGGFVLIPCMFVLKRVAPAASETDNDADTRARFRMGVIGGICCGCALCLASMLQQIGIMNTSVGKAGFITSLYIIIVPILGLFLRKKAGWNIWISVAIAAVGMYLLCITENFSVGRGDFMVMLCAVAFAVHILVVDYFSPKADGVLISCVQFFTAAVIAGGFMLVFEHPTWQTISAAWAPILYAGVMSCGVAYTLQVVAQKDISPTVASLLMSLESVFSVLAGWVILGQKLSRKELFGCALVFAAVVLAQIPGKEK